MWGCNQEMARQYFAFLADEPPVLVDGFPWSDTFGSNASVGAALYNGGTLYIDHGRPAAEGIEETVRNLRRIAPTLYWATPEGFRALMPHLRGDPELARRFFSRLKLLYGVGAGMSRQLWDDLAEISVETTGERVVMLSGRGSAETASHALFGARAADGPGVVLLPAPGIELKLVPLAAGRMEARLRGPNITWGYWRRPDLTRPAFDEEGFFKSGDVLRLADERDPSRGFLYDGRL
jgi:feruloyl-CoA synthase